MTNLASSSRRIERPEQSSRHSLTPESLSPDDVFDLKRFSAIAKVSRPGRSPASNVSFAGCGLPLAATADFVCRLEAAEPAAVSTRLRHSQNFIEPRFEVLLPLRPQTDALYRQGFLHRAHPTHQFLDILS